MLTKYYKNNKEMKYEHLFMEIVLENNVKIFL